MSTTFPERIQYAIKRVGGNQSELARRVSQITGRKCTAQAIQKLADANAAKPATSSGLTVAIAMAAEVDPRWLAYGLGEPHPPTETLIQRALARINDGSVPAELSESLFSLMRAIAGSSRNPTPHIAEPDAAYQTGAKHPKKAATA